MQRRGARRDGEHVLGLEELAHPALELGDARAGREPAGADRLGHGGHFLLADGGRLERGEPSVVRTGGLMARRELRHRR